MLTLVVVLWYEDGAAAWERGPLGIRSSPWESLNAMSDTRLENDIFKISYDLSLLPVSVVVLPRQLETLHPHLHPTPANFRFSWRDNFLDFLD